MWYMYTMEYYLAIKKSERVTEHERLLTLGNELGVMEGEEGGGLG